jgi:hypothetical protein
MRLLKVSFAFCALALVVVVAFAVLAGCSAAPRSGVGLSQVLPASTASAAAANEVLKAADTPPINEADRITNIAYHINPSESYILTWNYRMLGDYNLTLNVDVSDITPIAMHFAETWDINGSPNSAAAVVDGSGNGIVGVEDLTQIAMNYNRTIASFRVEGSASIDGTYAEVGNVVFPIELLLADGIPAFAFDLGTAPGYDWYRVVPLDGEGIAGIESLPIHFVPGGGGGLVIGLVTTPVTGTGLETDPFVIITATPYEITVEDEHGVHITAGVTFTVHPPFLASVTSTSPFIITHTGTLTGDFYVEASIGSLVSNRLYFRIPGTP